MSEQFLLLVRLCGYALNIALLIATVLKFPHHGLVLGAWAVWLCAIALAVLARYAGNLTAYLLLIDVLGTPLLYVNAFLAAWVLLKHEPKK